WWCRNPAPTPKGLVLHPASSLSPRNCSRLPSSRWSRTLLGWLELPPGNELHDQAVRAADRQSHGALPALRYSSSRSASRPIARCRCFARARVNEAREVVVERARGDFHHASNANASTASRSLIPE